MYHILLNEHPSQVSDDAGSDDEDVAEAGDDVETERDSPDGHSAGAEHGGVGSPAQWARKQGRGCRRWPPLLAWMKEFFAKFLKFLLRKLPVNSLKIVVQNRKKNRLQQKQ